MSLLKAIETLEDCRFCLMCTHVAPVGQVTRREALTPHGVALTVTSQKRGLIDWNEETVGIVFSEVDGGNSRAHCVNNQPFEEAVAAVRADLVMRDLAPTAVTTLKEKLANYQTPFAENKPQPAAGKGDIALFVGDEAPYLWPQTMPAVLKLLNALEIEPATIGIGRHNGFTAQSIGLTDIARHLIHASLHELKVTRANTLMLLSPGDYFVFSQLMTERVGIERPSDLQLVEVTSFLADKLAAGKITFKPVVIDKPYAYVDPTHAVRLPERHETVRQLLTAVMPTEPVELFFRKERAFPVGSTHLQFSNPALAEALTHGRLQDAQASGARLIVCEDPATLYQLNRFAQAYDLEVKGLYELLAEQIV